MFASHFSSSVGVVGIDLGSRAVKMLQVREVQGGLRVVGAARVEAPAGQGANTDWVPSAEQILSAFTHGGFTGRRCVVCLPRSDVRVQALRLPRMNERELTQAAEWEAAHRFEMERSAMEVDHIPTAAAVQGNEERQETLVVAAPHAALERRLAPVLAAGLRPVAVDVDFAALARALSRHARRESDRDLTRAVLEVGFSGSAVMILRGDSIAFYKPLSIRGADMSRAVAEHLHIDIQAASEIRVARMASRARPGGPEIDAATDRAVYEAVRPLLNDLVREVVLCLRYYGVTFRGFPPCSILLAGGEGCEKNLDSLLAQACKVPVEIDEPRGTFAALGQGIEGMLNRPAGPPTAWAVAAGLSLRSLTSRARARRHQEPQGAREAAA